MRHLASTEAKPANAKLSAVWVEGRRISPTNVLPSKSAMNTLVPNTNTAIVATVPAMRAGEEAPSADSASEASRSRIAAAVDYDIVSHPAGTELRSSGINQTVSTAPETVAATISNGSSNRVRSDMILASDSFD